jgi:PAS domain S-box-containing protein
LKYSCRPNDVLDFKTMIEDFGFSDFFLLTPDLVWVAGKDGFLRKANPAVCRKLGYSLEELLSKPVTAFMHPADIEKTLQNRFKLFEGEVLHNFCNRYITKTGDIVWLEWTSVFIADKEVVLGIAKDITNRKKIEQENEDRYIKFKGLASHFKNRIENDRKYFAYELHEELAQLLSAVNMDVSWLYMQLDNMPESVKNRIAHASETCKIMIKTIQRLAFSISPQMLDDFGLNATIEWLCSEFTILNGIECSFKHDYDESGLTNEMKLDFFRICQEALSVILNNSDAGEIKVSIKEIENNIELLIHDAGYVFSTDVFDQSSALKSIQERTKSINGKMTLQNHLIEGTSLSVIVEKQYSSAVY